MKLDGLHDIDLMTNSDGEPCVIEVNPRYSGSIAASLTAGVPLIDIAIFSMLGEVIPNFFLESDVTILLDDDDIMKVEL